MVGFQLAVPNLYTICLVSRHAIWVTFFLSICQLIQPIIARMDKWILHPSTVTFNALMSCQLTWQDVFLGRFKPWQLGKMFAPSRMRSFAQYDMLQLNVEPPCTQCLVFDLLLDKLLNNHNEYSITCCVFEVLASPPSKRKFLQP